MLTAPDKIMRLLEPFRPVFSDRVWGWAQVLLLGAILAPGRRTVTRILRVIGRGEERQFQNYHRVLNRAVWSELALSQQLLRVLVDTFVPAEAAIVLGADETLERRRGAHIAELGCYRDAARSTARNKVKSMGLRWLSLMLIVPLPWASRPWALPFLTVSTPSPAVDAAHKRRHKTSVDWLRQMLLQVVRWLPGRRIVLVADGGLASVDVGHCGQTQQTPVTYVTRLRLDARLFDPPPPRQPGTRGRKPVVGARQMKASQPLGDGQTVWHHVRVADRPFIQAASVTVVPPAYTGKPPEVHTGIPPRLRLQLERGQWRAQFVADAGEVAALGLVGGFGFFFCGLQCAISAFMRFNFFH